MNSANLNGCNNRQLADGKTDMIGNLPNTDRRKESRLVLFSGKQQTVRCQRSEFLA